MVKIELTFIETYSLYLVVCGYVIIIRFRKCVCLIYVDRGDSYIDTCKGQGHGFHMGGELEE